MEPLFESASDFESESDLDLSKPGDAFNARFNKLFGNSVNEFYEIGLDKHFDTGRKATRKKTYRKRKAGALDEALSRQMGLANNHYLNEDYEAAIPLLLDIIRTAPDSTDAYNTLGVIYEHQGNRQKSLDLYILAALLNPTESRWKELASLAVYEKLLVLFV